MSILDEYVGTWTGTCAFRLMPSDDLAAAPSHAASAVEADGHGWSLRYTWVHPQDGEQSGTLLLGSRMEGDAITAGWVDSWHQKPELRLLTGTVSHGSGESGEAGQSAEPGEPVDPGEARVTLAMEYEGWGWTIQITPDGDDLRMSMHNVVPAGIEGAPAGPYLVMDAVWNRAGAAMAHAGPAGHAVE